MEGDIERRHRATRRLRIYIHSEGPIHYEGTIRPKSHQLALSSGLGSTFSRLAAK